MKRKLLLVICTLVIAIAGAIGLSACSKVREILLKAPENIAYDGTYITWDKVDNAEYYMVQIGNAEAARSNSTTYFYEANGELFDVTVSSVLGETQESTSVTFKPLATIAEVFVGNDGSISWDTVSGANAYQISINGTVLANNITDTRYTELPEGSNRVKVKPVVSGDNTFYSFWSAEKDVYIYSVPTNVRYDGVSLTWQGNAASYEVNVNGKVSTVTGNSMDYDSENRDFNVTIKALGNYTSTYDSKTVSEDFYYLDTVKELKVEDGIVKWDAVERAESYKVRVNGVVQNAVITDTQYDKLPSGRSNDVQVMPVNESGNYFSSWSAEKTIYILDTPTVNWNNDLELDGEANNNLTWNAVNSANGYMARIALPDGTTETETFSSVQRALAHAYTDVGVYKVEIKATAAVGSADFYDSKYSEAYTIERLVAPKAAAKDFIVSNRDSLAQGFTVNFVPVSGASRYQLYRDGALRDGKTTTGTAITETGIVDSSAISEQHFTYMVRSMGSYNASRREVKLPCLSEDALSFDITVLAAPQSPTMNGFMLSWNPVSNSSGYSVAFAGQTVTAQAETFDLEILNAGSYSVTVCARGNGSDVLASNFSSPVAIERLQAPTNIKIMAGDENNGTLEYDEVANALSYQVFLDLSQQALDETSWDNMYQFIETDGTTLNMIAVANYYNNNHTLYYMTSQASPTQQFIRLAAPEFPEGVFADSNLMVWNAPDNINTSEYTPTYRVYSAKDEQIGGGDVNGTRFDISYLEGGKSYTFLIKAIGNDTKYLDSEYSIAITVYKLATPEFTIQNGQYVWQGVANASSYYMEIDGVMVTADFHVSGSTYAYTPRYTQRGDHQVTLKAIGDARNNLDSGTFLFTQRAEILTAPEIDYEYSADTVVSGGKIIVTVTKQSPNCAGYQYEVAGQTITSAETSVEKLMENTGTYTIRVKALGGSFDSDGVYYVDSDYAGGNSGYQITLLARPGGFSINSDGVIKWNNVQNAYGYEYQISFDGGAFSEITSTGYNTLDPIPNYRQYHTITIKVRAKGNATGTVITSDWVEWTWTNSQI